MVLVSEFHHPSMSCFLLIEQTASIGWYSEELFARFEVLEQRGSIVKNLAN